MISEILELSYPRDRLPILSPSMMHGHYVDVESINNQIIIWRDGRDVMVSQYYHFLIPWENGLNSYDINYYRKKFRFNDYNDIKRNMPRFIEMTADKKINKFSWGDFVDRWINDKKAVFTKI